MFIQSSVDAKLDICAFLRSVFFDYVLSSRLPHDLVIIKFCRSIAVVYRACLTNSWLAFFLDSDEVYREMCGDARSVEAVLTARCSGEMLTQTELM